MRNDMKKIMESYISMGQEQAPISQAYLKTSEEMAKILGDSPEGKAALDRFNKKAEFMKAIEAAGFKDRKAEENYAFSFEMVGRDGITTECNYLWREERLMISIKHNDHVIISDDSNGGKGTPCKWHDNLSSFAKIDIASKVKSFWTVVAGINKLQ